MAYRCDHSPQSYRTHKSEEELRKMPQNRKKSHHYVPQVYLKNFADASGKVNVYRKEDPTKAIQLSPKNVGFHKFYYSQPLPVGGSDDNNLEDLFSGIEDKWPRVLRVLEAKGPVLPVFEALWSFIALQRVRVPAARDMVEAMLAAHVRANAKLLDASGRLPDKPAGLEVADFWEKVGISIDPHKSIQAMPKMLEGMTEILKRIYLVIIHNDSSRPFLTSDNPVCWYDPAVDFNNRHPYTLERNSDIEFVFPITPKILLFGASDMREGFRATEIAHHTITSDEQVSALNATICRFGYDAVFAQSGGQEYLIRGNCDGSPIFVTQEIPMNSGMYIFGEMRFAKRPKKTKWEGL